jgi:hypothetical protein
LFVAIACSGADGAANANRTRDDAARAPAERAGQVDEAASASRTLDGEKVEFPPKAIPDGVKACIGVLESCHASQESSDATADLKKPSKGITSDWCSRSR